VMGPLYFSTAFPRDIFVRHNFRKFRENWKCIMERLPFLNFKALIFWVIYNLQQTTQVSPREREIRSRHTAWHHQKRHPSAVPLFCNALYARGGRILQFAFITRNEIKREEPTALIKYTSISYLLNESAYFSM
jgi:hypothetical protein